MSEYRKETTRVQQETIDATAWEIFEEQLILESLNLEVNEVKSQIRVQQEKLQKFLSIQNNLRFIATTLKIAEQQLIPESLNVEVNKVKVELDELEAKYDKLLSKRNAKSMSLCRFSTRN